MPRVSRSFTAYSDKVYHTIHDNIRARRNRVLAKFQVLVRDEDMVEIVVPSNLRQLSDDAIKYFNILPFVRLIIRFGDGLPKQLMFTKRYGTLTTFLIPKGPIQIHNTELYYEKIVVPAEKFFRQVAEWDEVRCTFDKLCNTFTTSRQIETLWPCVAKFYPDGYKATGNRVLPVVSPELRAMCKATMVTVAKSLMMDLDKVTDIPEGYFHGEIM